MPRGVVLLSPLAKAAATVGFAGGALAIYGNVKDVPWASGVGAILLFAGAITYYVERFRLARRARRPPRDAGEGSRGGTAS